SCTGETDHTAFLQGQINKVVNGGTLQINGRCRLGGELRIVQRQNVVVQGPAILDGSTNTASARHIRLQGGHGITVRDLTILGARGNCSTGCKSDPLFRQHGVAIVSTSGDPITDVVIERTEISGINGDFVYLGAKDNPKDDLPIGLSPAAAAVLPTDADLPQRITITNNRFINSGRQGISVSGGNQVLISGNHIEAAGRTTFDFEAEAGGALLVEISNNQVLQYDNAVVNVGCADRGGLGLLNRGPIKVLNNTTYGQDLKINTSCAEADAILEVQGNTRIG
ncbi:MAG: right-handed parallel beta-helix repeat-containing protein, partial [Pseudonocardiaceae bacterium]